jgi:very-short-patch-repair endonuclease
MAKAKGVNSNSVQKTLKDNNVKSRVELYNSRASKVGCVYLGDETVGSKDLASWKCSKGHVFQCRPNSIQRGHSCPYCNSSDIKYVLFRNNCKTVDEYGQKIAKENPNNIKYIGGFVNYITKAEWECSRNHHWKATPNNIKTGYGCPYCEGTDIEYILFREGSPTIEEYLQKIGDKVGLIYVDGYKGNHKKANWKCKKDPIHPVIAIRPNSILSRAHGCSYCNGSGMKYVLLREGCSTIEEYLNKIGGETGLVYMDGYCGIMKKANWRCKKDLTHPVVAIRPNNVSSGKAGCSYCNGNDIKYVLFRNNCKTVDEYGHKIAAENPNDIKYIGGFVDNNKTKAEWECGKGHRWKTTPNNIQQGSGCPACAKCISKKEQALFLEVQKTYPDAINNTRQLLKNTRYELDIFIPNLNKAIEFDGGRWHAFPDAIRRDTEKDVMCTEAGIALYRVKESDWDIDKDVVVKNVLEFLKA